MHVSRKQLAHAAAVLKVVKKRPTGQAVLIVLELLDWLNEQAVLNKTVASCFTLSP